jgi:hypothetical protein
MLGEMTAAEALRLNGDMKRDSPLMEAIRRFHALSVSRGFPYCIIGGAAVIRNGYPRTTVDVDVLTLKSEWKKVLPLEGEIHSDGADACTDVKTGLKIDIRFSEDDWGMPIAMPDPRRASEFDEGLGGRFTTLHDLVQLKTAVYLAKLRENGEDVASKDRSDVFELIRRNLARFSQETLQAYPPAVRDHCLKAFESALRAEKRTP